MGNQRNRMRDQLVVRMDTSMMEALRRDAALFGRTLAQTVRFRLAENDELRLHDPKHRQLEERA